MDEMLQSRMDGYVTALESLGDESFFRIAKIQSVAMVAGALEAAINDLDADPLPRLTACLDAQRAFLATVGAHAPDLAPGGGKTDGRSPMERTEELFECAWTQYSDATYDHSVALVEARLSASGVTPETIGGKRCLDGGCGTGRLSLALARMGAAEVVAMDFGQESLDFFARQLERHGVDTVTLVRGDVTDLSRFADGEFDFVASYGVLHHTRDPLVGLMEHMRVLRPGGELWLYLYGAGGLYWRCYDMLRPVFSRYEPGLIRSALSGLGVREGFAYTIMDNVLAPRTYHTIGEITALLGQRWNIDWREADGPAVWDNPSRTVATRHGARIVGPEGEVRIVVAKRGDK